jgi:hypothetical protein
MSNEVLLAESVKVAAAMTAALKAASFSQAIDPKRSYVDWDGEKLKDPSALRVDVVADSTQQKTKPATRVTSKFTIPVFIVVRKKLNQEQTNDDSGDIDEAEIDALIYLCQELHLFFTLDRLPGLDSAVWEETETLALPSKKHLREIRQFTALIKVQFSTVLNKS